MTLKLTQILYIFHVLPQAETVPSPLKKEQQLLQSKEGIAVYCEKPTKRKETAADIVHPTPQAPPKLGIRMAHESL